MGHNGTSPLLVPWMCQDCQDGSTSKWLSGSDPTSQELEGMEEMPLNAKVEFLPHKAQSSEKRRCDYGGRRAQAGCGPCKNWGRARLWQIRGSCPSSKSEENFA